MDPAHRWRRWIGWVTVAVGLVVLVAFVRWPIPAGFAGRLLGDRLQREVTVAGGWFRLAPWPSLQVDEITIGPPADLDADRFATARDVGLTLGWRTLSGGRLHLRSLSIGQADVLLARAADGRATWSLPADDAREGRHDAATRGSAWPRIGRVDIGGVDWRLRDAVSEADLRGTMTWRTSRDTDAVALRIDARGQVRDQPATIALRSDRAGVGEPVPLVADLRIGAARASFDGVVGDPAALDGLDGALRVRGASLGAVGAWVGVLLPATPSFTLDGRLRRHGPRWTVTVEAARIGASDLRGEVAYEAAEGGSAPTLRGELASDRMRLVDLGRSVGFGTGPGRRDRVLPDVSLDLPSLQGMEAAVRLAFARLELPGLAPARDVAVRLRLAEGVLALGELRAQLADGRLEGDLQLDGRREPGSLKLRLVTRGVALERWLPELKGSPALAARLNGELVIAGRGDSVADVLAAADGHLRLAVGPGTASGLLVELAGLDVAESLVALAGPGQRVRLDCAIANLRIERGVARPDPLVIDTHDSLIAAHGTIDLRTERMDLTLRTSPRDASPVTVRAPIRVQGTFADPAVGVDRAQVAGTVVASVLLGALVTPLAALLPLLDFGDGDTPSPCRDRLAIPSKPPAAAPSGGTRK